MTARRPAGLPDTAIAVTDMDGKVYWSSRAVKAVLRSMSSMRTDRSAEAGTIEQLQEVYPTLDLSPLMDGSSAEELDEEDPAPASMRCGQTATSWST